MKQGEDADLFTRALGSENGTSYRLSRAMADAFPNHAIVQIDSAFQLEEYARAGLCKVVKRTSPHAEIRYGWRRTHGLVHSMAVGIFDVQWKNDLRDEVLTVAVVEWPEGYRTREFSYVIGNDRTTVEAFASEVCVFCNDPHHAILTFRGGCWEKDRDIYAAIQASSFDELVLAGDLSRDIREDFSSFLGAKDEYAKYGVPWKRGVLFLGPPGNGKTHCLRATIKLLGVPCLYVQSLKSRYETDDANIAKVFDRARQITPCCLVFEDLDAMITPQNRSTFLNQLDGFANASGMLTLATTNHPEKLDPAILERPSRFDRKYHFALPGPSERARYIASWRERLDPKMRIQDDQIDRLVTETDGFSFAYLKELFLSAMIRWIKLREEGGMFALLESQLLTLREQMKTEPAVTPSIPRASTKEEEEDDDD